MSGLNPRVDVRRERRVLPPEQFSLLIESTRQGKPFRGLPGNDRVFLYLTAAYTGFRESELASLTVDSFDFDSDPPSVVCGAAYSKRRRRDTQPLRNDLAELLRQWI